MEQLNKTDDGHPEALAHFVSDILDATINLGLAQYDPDGNWQALPDGPTSTPDEFDRFVASLPKVAQEQFLKLKAFNDRCAAALRAFGIPDELINSASCAPPISASAVDDRAETNPVNFNG